MAISLTGINDENIYRITASATQIRNKNIERVKMLLQFPPGMRYACHHFPAFLFRSR